MFYLLLSLMPPLTLSAVLLNICLSVHSFFFVICTLLTLVSFVVGPQYRTVICVHHPWMPPRARHSPSPLSGSRHRLGSPIRDGNHSPAKHCFFGSRPHGHLRAHLHCFLCVSLNISSRCSIQQLSLQFSFTVPLERGIPLYGQLFFLHCCLGGLVD